MSFKKNRHPAEPLFKQHKILNFEKQKTLVAIYLRTVYSVSKIYAEPAE